MMEAKQYRELLKISAVPMMKLEYYQYHLQRYESLITPTAKELPPPAPGPVLSADSAEAKVVLMDVFTTLKRSLGYGGQPRR